MHKSNLFGPELLLLFLLSSSSLMMMLMMMMMMMMMMMSSSVNILKDYKHWDICYFSNSVLKLTALKNCVFVFVSCNDFTVRSFTKENRHAPPRHKLFFLQRIN